MTGVQTCALPISVTTDSDALGAGMRIPGGIGGAGTSGKGLVRLYTSESDSESEVYFAMVRQLVECRVNGLNGKQRSSP